MKPLHYYFLGTGFWFLSYGIQSVAFAWLVTIVLHESATMVGLAQMAFLTPAMLLMLIGGSLADQLGGRRIAIIGHFMAASAPMLLVIMITISELTYSLVIAFAIIMGCAQALVTPARDGLLAEVAAGRIQKRVVQVSMIQFGIQMIGFLVAALADTLGARVILLMQASFLLLGAFAFLKMQMPHENPPRLSPKLFQQVTRSITEGFNTVSASPRMRAIVIQNCAMGVFFMGSYIVTIPLLIREVHEGSSLELSWVNAANSLGLVLTIMLLMRFGDVQRQGRALLISQGLGSIALFCAGLSAGFNSLLFFIFVWGLCGGIAMTMSRTVMQELAPQGQRARMMAFYSFSFMGSGPIGALLCGFLVDWVGPTVALLICPACMLVVVVIVAYTSPLWSLDTGLEEMSGDSMPAGSEAISSAAQTLIKDEKGKT